MAVHYGTAIIPARVRHPQDKAKVETAVQIVERWILAPLRGRTFFDLPELNRVIWELLDQMNKRPFQKLPGSRWYWFLSTDKPALLPLPQTRYTFAQWKCAKVTLTVLLRHQGHHCRQMTILMRQAGLQVPGICGPAREEWAQWGMPPMK